MTGVGLHHFKYGLVSELSQRAGVCAAYQAPLSCQIIRNTAGLGF